MNNIITIYHKNFQINIMRSSDIDTDGNIIYFYTVWDEKGRQVDADLIRASNITEAKNKLLERYSNR